MSETAGGDKRPKILEAAIRVFSSHGFHGATMAMIAREAGVAAGTLYLYFEGKEALIGALYLEFKGSAFDEVLKDYPAEGSARARFEHLWTRQLAVYRRRPEVFRFLEQFQQSPFLDDAARELTQRYYGVFFKLLEDGLREGVLRPLDPMVAVALCGGAIPFLVKAELDGRIVLDEATIAAACDGSWRAIAV